MNTIKQLATWIAKSQGRSTYLADDDTLIIAQQDQAPQIIIKANHQAREIMLKIPAQAIQLYFGYNTRPERILQTLMKYDFFNDFSRLRYLSNR